LNFGGGDGTHDYRCIVEREALNGPPEFHLGSDPDAKLQWLTGVYYFNDKAGNDPLDIAGLSNQV
jgi:hypothetical protein